MAFRITMMMVALALCRVGHSQNPAGETWTTMDPANVPSDVVSFAEQKLIDRFDSDHGVRLVQISSAEYKVLTNKHYKLTILFDVTECPKSASSQDIKNESSCPQTSSITCSVRVYQQRSSQAYQLFVSRCSP